MDRTELGSGGGLRVVSAPARAGFKLIGDPARAPAGLARMMQNIRRRKKCQRGARTAAVDTTSGMSNATCATAGRAHLHRDFGVVEMIVISFIFRQRREKRGLLMPSRGARAVPEYELAPGEWRVQSSMEQQRVDSPALVAGNGLPRTGWRILPPETHA